MLKTRVRVVSSREQQTHKQSPKITKTKKKKDATKKEAGRGSTYREGVKLD